jgi:hypothetical protein
VHFYLNQRTENFLHGHEQAFQAFGGVPRVLLYDNLKSAVLERQGDAIRFNPTLLAFAAHYHFEPRPCAVYRGNEKGRVERAIRYIRDHFFAARTYRDLADLNVQASQWCEQHSANRPCPEDKTKSVREVFEEEQSRLIAIPDTPFPINEVERVHIGKTPYARFDWNDYSVPHDQVRKTLTIQATQDRVTVLDGAQVLAQHPRSYDKARQIECPEHIKTLIDRKKQARLHRGQNRLTHAVDGGRAFLDAAALRGYSLKTTTSQLLSLLDDYGAAALEEAMSDALNRDVPHPNAVRLSLQRQQDERGLPPQVPLSLSDDKRLTEQVVKPHKLSDYEVLNQSKPLEEQS